MPPLLFFAHANIRLRQEIDCAVHGLDAILQALESIETAKLRNLDMIIRLIRESILAAQGLALRAGFMVPATGMTGSHTSPVFTGNDAT